MLLDIWARTGKRIFLITHSIEEALFLGTDIIVMSPRPGRIVARYDRRFRPASSCATRDARAIKAAPAFAALREEIRALIHQGERSQERRRMSDVAIVETAASAEEPAPPKLVKMRDFGLGDRSTRRHQPRHRGGDRRLVVGLRRAASSFRIFSCRRPPK